MAVEIVVGLLSLSGIIYMVWAQRELRRSQTRANQAEALAHLTSSVINTTEALAERDALIAELRARIEALEQERRLLLLGQGQPQTG